MQGNDRRFVQRCPGDLRVPLDEILMREAVKAIAPDLVPFGEFGRDRVRIGGRRNAAME
jgi:hypothetical protein